MSEKKTLRGDLIGPPVRFDNENYGVVAVDIPADPDEAFRFKAEPKVKCRGLVFRGYTSLFATPNGVEQRQGVRLLKRRSCSGCEACGGLLEYLWEDVHCMDVGWLNNIENKKLYYFYIDTYLDGETGNWETDGSEFYEYEEKNDESI